MLQEGQRRGRWGRKLDLVTLDDGYSPPKTVERVRRLVEQDEVLRVFQTLGTPSDSAIHARMNGKKLPQTVPLQGSGANVFFDIATPKFAAQAIRKACDTIWKPTQYVANVSVSVATVPTPAGLDKSVGLLSSIYGKDPTDTRRDNDPG